MLQTFGLGWPGGNPMTINYTKGVSIGVVYIPSDTDYDDADYMEIVSGTTPTGITWASYGTCAGTKLCTAFYGTSNATTTNAIVIRAHHLGVTSDLTVNFQPNFALTGAVASSGVVNVAYNSSLSLVGGSAPFSYSVASGTLPPGLSLNSSTGAISGTPTTAGVYTFTLQAFDSVPLTATSSSQSIAIHGALAVTTSSLADTSVGATYSQTLTSSGGTTPKTWSVISGALPAGLNLNASSGAITGTPSSAGTSNFTVQVACCTSATASQALSITVNAAPSITTSSLPGGGLGIAYSQTLAATGGTGALTWSVSAGALPSGVTLSSAGVLSGTPTASGTFNFTARAVDAVSVAATRSLSLVVTDAPSISTSSLAALTATQTVSQTIGASGGTTPYTWSISSGVLPAGLSLNASTGAITGTATTAGSYSFTVLVTDAGSATDSKALNWTVNAAPAITTSSLNATTVGATYSASPAATGGTGSRTWTVASGALPAGVSLNASTGALTGTPSSAGTASFTLQVADTNSITASQALSIVVNAAPAITTASLADGTIGAAYSRTLAATGGTGALTWTVSSGALPTGLTLSTAGVLSGTPTTAGTATFTVRAADTASVAGTRALSLTVLNPPAITAPTFSTLTATQSVSQTLASTGGTAPYTWSITGGALPAGLSLNSSTGVITGTASAAGTYSFTIQVTDASSLSDTASGSWTVNAAPAITTASLPESTFGPAYPSATLAATGGTGTLTFSATGLPSGLSLSTAGVLSGTPAAAGSTSVQFQVTDANSVSASRTLTLTVNVEPAVTTTTLPLAVNGQAYSQTLTATGGTGARTWSVVSGALPAGLSLSPAGVLSGTASANVTANFTVQVADSVSVTASRALSLLVATGPAVLAQSLPALTPGQQASANLTASQGTPPYQWSITTGALPAGLTLDAATGAIGGQVTATSTAAFTATVRDANNLEGSRAFTWQVNPALRVTIPAGRLVTGKPAPALALNASGGTPPLMFHVTGLPAGLSVDESSGEAGGIPINAGEYTLTATVTDANGVRATGTGVWLVVPGVTITPTPFRPLTAGRTTNQPVALNGGTAPFRWSITGGQLPAGLTLHAANGVLQGAAQAAGTKSVTFEVIDANGITDSASYEIVVNPPLALTPGAPPVVFAGQALSHTFQATGGTAPLTWSLAGGALPAGITLSAAGVLSGTPIAPGDATFSVQVSDANGATASAPITVSVDSVLRAAPGALVFEADEGRPAPAPQHLTVQSAAAQQPVRITSDAPWLTVSPDQGTTPLVADVSVATASLAAGSYPATLTISGTETRTVAVLLTVHAAPDAALSANPAAITLRTPAGDEPARQLVTLRAGEAGAAWRATPGEPWLTVEPAQGVFDASRTAALLVSTRAAALAPGRYETAITVIAGAQQATIPVALEVSAASHFELSYSGLAFSAIPGTVPEARTVSILNRAASPLAWTAAANVPWIRLDQSGGSTSEVTDLQVSIDPSGLPAGTHNGIVTVTDSPESVSRQVEVLLTLSESAPRPSAAPAGILVVTRGSGEPQARAIRLSNPRLQPVSFTASIAPPDAAGWLSLPTASGAIAPSGSTELQVLVNAPPAAVPAQAQITVEFSDGTVNVVTITSHPAGPECLSAAPVLAWVRFGDAFSTPAGAPANLAVTAVDGCGEPLHQGAGLVLFSHPGEQAVPLIPSPTGLWTATWTPVAAADSIMLTVTVQDTAGRPALLTATGRVTAPAQ